MPDEFQAEPPRQPLHDRDDMPARPADNPFQKRASHSSVILVVVLAVVALLGCAGLFVVAGAYLFLRK